MNDHGAAWAAPGMAQAAANSKSVSAGRRMPRACQPFCTLAAAMEKFFIEGGYPLSGTVVPAGNKNAALPVLAACLLTEEEVVLRNVPRIRDVEAMLELLEHLGVEIESREDNALVLCAANVDAEVDIPVEKTERIRASFLVAGPLLARFGRAVLPPPGGDVIGRRRLDPHLDAFRALGARVGSGRVLELEAPGGLEPCDFFMDEPSVMATENALMAAALIDGTTVIRNAASEPHVQDLARMLVKMGTAVEGIGSNVMTVHGLSELGGVEHTVTPDHIEIASFMALAGVTGGALTIKGCIADDLRMIRLAFQRLGLHSEMQNGDCLVPGGQELRVERDAGDYQSKIEDGPWPAFPADLTSIAVALATQADGSVL